jgi:5-methylcytosine-specific restriction protein A
MVTADNKSQLAKKNYVRKASSIGNYWFYLSQKKLTKYIEETNGNFNIIIYSELNSPDFYSIPFSIVKDVFIEDYLSNDRSKRNRWIGTIQNQKLRITNCPLHVDLSSYYSLPHLVDSSKNPGGLIKENKACPITNWSDILDNLYEFSHIERNPNCYTAKHLSSFSNWYYFRDYDLFAPGKFLGYKNTSIENYSGLGDGYQAKVILNPFFEKVNPDSTDFEILKDHLGDFVKRLNAQVNLRTLEGTGGIFISQIHLPDNNAKYSEYLIYENQQQSEPIVGIEGLGKAKLSTYYERLPRLKAEAIRIHGTKCKVCDFDFTQHYGIHGRNFIEVHHIVHLHNFIEPKAVHPETDMTVLCSNCHRMIHRKKNAPLSVEELRILWKRYHAE